jgi:hypothetical protein
MKPIDLNQLRDRAYKCACEHGFHDEELSDEHLLCLVISELMEAVEADRKGNYCYNKMSSTERYSLFPTEERRFGKEFSAFIKDTVEDELADAVIRLLDWYGTRSIVIDNADFEDEVIEDYAGIYKNKSFTESIFNITRSLTDKDPGIAILKVFGLAKHLGIDLFWHMEQKQKYNELRPYKHGKAY